MSAAGTISCAADHVEFTASVDVIHVPDSVTLAGVSGAAADASGNIYVLQRGTPPVLSFDRHGKYQRSWGETLVGSGHGLSVDPDGSVWVTDTGHHLVYKFSPEGNLLLALGKADQPGEGEDQFDKPTFVAFGPEGQLVVADGYGNSRLVVFDSQGKFLRTWGRRGTQPGEFHSPHQLAVDASGRILVADRDNQRIQIFSLDGDLLDTWSDGRYTPFGVCISPDGVIFVADGKLHMILQLDARGHPVHSWGTEGTAVGEFRTPHLITADLGGNLYVAEVGGRRLQMLLRQHN